MCSQMCELGHSNQSFFCNSAHVSRTLTKTNGGIYRCPRFLPLSLSWPSWLSKLRRSHTHRTCTYSNRTVTRVPTASQSSATRQRQLAGCCRPLRMARTGAGRSWLHDADFHGAWRAPDGQLLDITPRRDDEDRVLFLTEPSSRLKRSPRGMWPP
jgi:hypothetical protein